MVYTATDKEQIEQIKKWWNDYGKAIAVAVVVGLLIGFGWRYWSRYHEAQENSASYLYQSMLQVATAQQVGAAIAYAGHIQQKFGHTVYATMAALMAARLDVLNQQYAQASTQLSWVFDNSRDASFRQVARIRDARVLLQMKEPELAMKVIAVVDDSHYQALIEEVKGEIYLAQHQDQAARAAFAKAQTAYRAAGLQNPFLDLRLSS